MRANDNSLASSDSRCTLVNTHSITTLEAQMSDLFSVLEKVLLDGESVAFHLTRKNGTLLGMIVPQLSVLQCAQYQSNSDVERARACLALPLRLEMPAAQMDAEFAERVRGYSAQRV